MWLINSSIGKKVIMSVTGLALFLFLTFHACMNVVALISGEAYNLICEFLGANWYALVGTAALAALAVVHILYAFLLTYQNRKARGNNRYAVTAKPEKVEWASQNMLVLGIIILLGFRHYHCMRLTSASLQLLVQHDVRRNNRHGSTLQPVRRLCLHSANIQQPNHCCDLPYMVSSIVVPPEPWLLEWHPNTRCKRQSVVQPLENHRYHLGNRRYCNVCCCRSGIRIVP